MKNFVIGADKKSLIVSIRDVKTFIIDIETLRVREEFDHESGLTVASHRDFYISCNLFETSYLQNVKQKKGGQEIYLT